MFVQRQESLQIQKEIFFSIFSSAARSESKQTLNPHGSPLILLAGRLPTVKTSELQSNHPCWEGAWPTSHQHTAPRGLLLQPWPGHQTKTVLKHLTLTGTGKVIFVYLYFKVKLFFFPRLKSCRSKHQSPSHRVGIPWDSHSCSSPQSLHQPGCKHSSTDPEASTELPILHPGVFNTHWDQSWLHTADYSFCRNYRTLQRAGEQWGPLELLKSSQPSEGKAQSPAVYYSFPELLMLLISFTDLLDSSLWAAERLLLKAASSVAKV